MAHTTFFFFPLGGGRHFKTDVKSLQQPKLHLVEQGTGTGRFGITALVTSP